MNLYSYHVFLFPFQWDVKDPNVTTFSKRYQLNNLKPKPGGYWQNYPQPESNDYQTELYNEKNFFYKFVHTAMYDDNDSAGYPAVKHYERQEAYNTDLIYEIGIRATRQSIYKLHLKSIGLDIFSTGTGVLIFYLENNDYPDFDDVRRINQYGRRIFPPFLGKKNHVEEPKKYELADYIAINGLMGEPQRYHEDYTRFKHSEPWGTARFIDSLISDFCDDIKFEPVVDDRMFTMCWYFNNALSNQISDTKQYLKFVKGDDWHKYLYVDSGYSTCQNDRMQKELLVQNTYPRWQKWGTLYGMTKYSFMVISEETGFPKDVALVHFRTIYVRIVELVLIQRASILKFSAEVCRLSSLESKDNRQLADQISDFYKAYIRFVNQIFFREITAQEQGIDLYDLLTDNMRIKDQVKDLDNEIGELHNYASLLDEKSQSRSLSLLTILGSLFLVPSFIVGYFGMNFFDAKDDGLYIQALPIVFSALFALAIGLFGIVQFNKHESKRGRNLLIVITALIIIVLLIFPVI
jgi:hypothetical protein